MARIGKITLFIDESRNGHTVTVAGTGKKGEFPLNGLNHQYSFPYVNAATSLNAYAKETLTEIANLLT